MMTTTHRQIWLETPSYQMANGKWSGSRREVDEKMKDILVDVWDLGCRTIYSCQGDLSQDRQVLTYGYLMYHAPFRKQVLEIVNFYTPITEEPEDCVSSSWPPGVWETVRFEALR